MTIPVVETHGLTRRYGAREAVDDLTLQVPAGSVYALLGPNGAGKTTTIKMLMDIVEPTAGAATVLGRPSSRLGPEEWRRIGYVSENQEMPSWMTVRQLIDYYRPFYPTWDDALSTRLLARFELPPAQKIRNLSRGMRMKVALLTALAYRPELLVLDEPFSGLDPLVRDEFVSGVLELTEQERWTVFVSSHDVDEVERLADWVGVLDAGRLYLSEPLARLQDRFRRLELETTAPATVPASIPDHWAAVEAAGSRVRIVDSRFREGDSEAEARRAFPGAHTVTAEPLSLREILVVLARKFRLVGSQAAGQGERA
jgi:ABC-2 type transport system ATP-binding protein